MKTLAELKKERAELDAKIKEAELAEVAGKKEQFEKNWNQLKADLSEIQVIDPEFASPWKIVQLRKASGIRFPKLVANKILEVGKSMSKAELEKAFHKDGARLEKALKNAGKKTSPLAKVGDKFTAKEMTAAV